MDFLLFQFLMNSFYDMVGILTSSDGLELFLSVNCSPSHAEPCCLDITMNLSPFIYFTFAM